MHCSLRFKTAPCSLVCDSMVTMLPFIFGQKVSASSWKSSAILDWIIWSMTLYFIWWHRLCVQVDLSIALHHAHADGFIWFCYLKTRGPSILGVLLQASFENERARRKVYGTSNKHWVNYIISYVAQDGMKFRTGYVPFGCIYSQSNMRW